MLYTDSLLLSILRRISWNKLSW